MPSASNSAPAQITASVDLRFSPKLHSSHSTVASIRKPVPCLTRSIHSPGFGQETQPPRKRRKQHERRAHARRDGGEHRHDHQPVLRESEPERIDEDRRGTRAAEHRRQHPLQERAGIPLARAAASPAALLMLPGKTTSKTPSRLSENTNVTTIRPSRNHGFCSWNE